MNNSSSSGGGTAPLENVDVYISCIEEDTGKGLVSHLDAAFARDGLKTSIRSNKLRTVDKSAGTRFEAILRAGLFLIVFSTNYASLPFLLDELEQIVLLSKTKKKIMVPVFYDVEPSAVRKLVGTYGEVFAKYAEMFKDDKYKVHSWKRALTEAASYFGWDCSVNFRTEHEIVEEIAKDVLEKLDRAYVRGLDLQIEKLEQLARLQEEFSKEVIVRIMKQTIKQTLYASNDSKWRRSSGCFASHLTCFPIWKFQNPPILISSLIL